MPRADPFLALKTALSGEGGTTPALAAVSDAIVDAVAELGVDHIEMLATPESLPQKSPSPIIGSNGPLLNPTPAIRSSPRECVLMPRSGHSPMAGQTVQSFGYADTKARCSGFEEPRVHSAGGVDEQEGIRPARHFNFARPMTFRPCGDRTLPADRVRNTRCRTSAIA